MPLAPGLSAIGPFREITTSGAPAARFMPGIEVCRYNALAMSANSLTAADCTVALTCHPATPCAAVRAIQVQVRGTAATLELCYRLEGELDLILVPAESTARRADKLWQHTCFEAFVRDAKAGGYLELNFSPSSEWAVYRFSGYRAGMTNAEAAAPRITVHRERGLLRLDVVVDFDSLPDVSRDVELNLALSAVIEESDRRLSYWALAHPAGKPDFHHADGFVLTFGSGG
jgi:hypothetical protein